MPFHAPIRTLFAVLTLVLAFAASPAQADCFQDARNQYDACVNAQYLFNGQLLAPSEEGCAEITAAATNLCLQAAGKNNPYYAECRLRYDFQIAGGNCPSGTWYTVFPSVFLEAKHLCSGFLYLGSTLTCN